MLFFYVYGYVAFVFVAFVSGTEFIAFNFFAISWQSNILGFFDITRIEYLSDFGLTIFNFLFFIISFVIICAEIKQLQNLFFAHFSLYFYFDFSSATSPIESVAWPDQSDI